MTYTEAIQFLYRLRTFGTKLGLGNTLKLAALAGDPHRRLRFIHVAGTNGKGSTCAMLESIYRHTGLRVGLFTSPHLIAFGERIQVNRRLVSEAGVVRLVARMKDLLAGFPADEHPTFFEVVTVMALSYFVEQECDLVIWETGLGGRLDATNIVTPLASVITNIQFDHENWLGETLASIAFEKAGIIKSGIPVITATDEPEALRVIEQVAQAKAAPLTIVPQEAANEPPLDSIQFPLLGQHQRLNAALAVATARVLGARLSVPEQSLCGGLSTVQWDGRLQLLNGSAGQRVLLDGAHNTGGTETLRAALDHYFPKAAPALVLGILADKNWRSICSILAPRSNRIFLTAVGSERTAPPRELEAACREANPAAEIVICGSVGQALEKAMRHPFVLVTGSLYLVGEALEYLKTDSKPAQPERGLNEWNAVASR